MSATINPFVEALAERGYTVEELRTEIREGLWDTWRSADGIERFCIKVGGMELNMRADHVRQAYQDFKKAQEWWND